MSNSHRQTRLYKTVCRVGRVSWTLDLERVPTVADSVHTARRDQTVFPARRYASAGTSYSPVSVCLRLFVWCRCSIEKNERINLVFGMEAFFRPVLHCVLRKVRYLQK